MHHVFLIVRIFGWMLALFFGASAYLTISGINASDEVVPLAVRVVSSIPAVLIAVLLFVPHDLFLAGRRYWLLLSGYMIAAGWVAWLLIDTALRYANGMVHGAAIVAGSILLLVIVCNGLVLIARRRTRPNESFKPMPLRGTA